MDCLVKQTQIPCRPFGPQRSSSLISESFPLELTVLAPNIHRIIDLHDSDSLTAKGSTHPLVNFLNILLVNLVENFQGARLNCTTI